ncbi:putative bifunctional diguanylate cyclase/phosphodiesterase [Aureimonas psammosilenae]|uniref:putative bifunctional diguanylate cyclase/phosphodiesterase n=1 Tax=Aureimonas psammosilenae TaxID=2495496 RepID=UPI001260F10D|nr:EAL domain-containing protein [Aureimonas psammosilenae]
MLTFPDAAERHRLNVLGSYEVLDTAAEPEFDRLVQLAADIFKAPIALVSLVAEHRQFFKARVGLPVCETARDVSFCQHAMTGEDVFVIPDARKDPRFRDNGLVTGAPFIRFYAGAPLRSVEGDALGSFCIIDREPREEFSAREARILGDLAGLVMELLESRRQAVIAAGARNRLQSIASTSPDAIITADATNTIISWNAAAERMFGYDVEEIIGQSLNLIVPPASRDSHRAGLARVASGEAPRLIGRKVEVTAVRRDGTEFPIELSLSRWLEDGEQRFGGIIRDITERHEAEQLLRTAAIMDALTGLANRAHLNERLAHWCCPDRRATVLLIDLDGFKEVNDTLGHAAGDLVLVEVAARLRACVGPENFIGRLGGDEFVVLIEGSADPLKGYRLGEAIIDALEIAINVAGSLVSISASIGIACSGEQEKDADTLLGEADLALYKAKRDGRGRTCLFTSDLRQAVIAKGLARTELAHAWQTRAFELYYQPQVELEEGILIGAEALLRWNHPTRGVLAPGAFLSMLESDAVALPVGRWIIETACRQAAEWRREVHPCFRVAVNLFAVQFKSGDLPDIVAGALSECGLCGSALELEITENTILQSDERILDQLRRLRDMGVAIAFDDFGTGFASLSMLRDYPVSRIKIDRSFVSGCDVSERDRAITQALIQMADGLDLKVIAEGIETGDDHHIMREQGCDDGQGYLYGRPMPAAEFLRRHLETAPGACHDLRMAVR